MTVATFRPEISQALQAYDRYVVCLERPPEFCQAVLHSLMEKAIDAYQKRSPNLRHGIALDKYFTVILSQSDTERPLCGIYFNLHTPYLKKSARLPQGQPETGGPASEPPAAPA